jgi:hypothetical protein
MTDDDHSLKRFLSGYFHEDWMEDAQDPADIVAMFLRDRKDTEDLHTVVRAIHAIVQDDMAEDELASRLFRQYGCYFDARGEGGSNRDWLREVAAQIEQEIAARSS